MRKLITLSLIIIIISFIIGIYYYPKAPSLMASHWNSNGLVDGYIAKFWGLFLIPILEIIFLLFLVFLPKIDPLNINIEKFRKYYDIFILSLIIFLFYVYILTILWNLKFKFNILVPLVPAFGILFFYSGILMENSHRNWFIGFKTPWTISDDHVWKKTNKLMGILFKLAGGIALVGIILPKYAIWLIIMPVILFSLYGIIYSYLLYRKRVKNVYK